MQGWLDFGTMRLIFGHQCKRQLKMAFVGQVPRSESASAVDPDFGFGWISCFARWDQRGGKKSRSVYRHRTTWDKTISVWRLQPTDESSEICKNTDMG